MSKKNSNLKVAAYQTIKERLINCEYAPGTFLNEAKIAEDLGISRTPIREAITRLEIEKLVKVLPKKGIYVSEITLADVQQIFQTRLKIEPLTIRMAADKLPLEDLMLFKEKFSKDVADIRTGYRLDTAMHLFIIEQCGNQYIIDMMHKLFEDNTRVIISSKQNQVQIHDAKNEHLEIIEELINHNTEGAAVLMEKHIENCRRAAFDYFYNLRTFNQTDSVYRQVLSTL